MTAGREEEGSTLLAWATGGAVLAACLDLLVAVVLALAEVPAASRGATVRDLALPLAGVSLASMAVAAATWLRPARALPAAALFHAAVAVLGWWWAGKSLGGIPRPLLAALGVHAAFAAVAMAGAAVEARAGGGRAGERLSSAAGAVAENLESVLVAIVFALVIRHFAVEAYKIPTQSMAPTLLGDDARRGPGDRVLVKKWDAAIGGPDRWEIWVFRPPLDRTINYVKRVAGLGGETVEIEDGDLYVDGTIARKPPRTREEMWYPVWPRADGGREPASPWSGEGFRKEGEDGFAVAGATERRLLRWERTVYDGATPGTGSSPVGDLRLRFEVAGAEPGTVLVVRITGRGGPCEARIPVEGGTVEATVNGAPAAPTPGGGGTAARGPVTSVEVFHADLQFGVRLDGGAALAAETAALPPGGRPSFSVSFGVEKGGATFRGVRLDRDVHYTGSHRFTVPEGHFFFLGDNSASSQDSRMWRGWETTETREGGRAFVSEARPYAGEDGRLEFRDRNGVSRSFAPGEVRISDGVVPVPFVPRADLHGRAFAIFWPPRWFTRMEGGRVRVLP